MLLSRVRRSPCRSLRDLFFIVIAVATVSVLITYNISRYAYITQQQQEEQQQQQRYDRLKIHINGHVDIFESIGPNRNQQILESVGDNDEHRHSLPGNRLPLSDHRQGLEGMDIEAWEKRIRERRKNITDMDRRTVAGMTNLRRHKLRPELVNKLKQIDQSLVLPSGAKKKLAIIQGDSSLITQQGSLYQKSLEGAGYTVVMAINTETDTLSDGQSSEILPDSGNHGYSRQLWDTGWSLGICLRNSTNQNSGSKHNLCQMHTTFTSLQSFQKINMIPSLDSMFTTKASFCVTMTNARYIPAVFLGTPLSPICHILPHQYEDFLMEAETRGPRTKWVLKPLGDKQGPVQLVEPSKDRDFMKIKRLSYTSTLVQAYVADPLPLYGLPFSITVYVLVTSWRPLRVHLHNSGTVHFRHDYQRNFRKMPGRTWSVDQWLHHVAATHSQSSADVARRNIDSVIVQTLLVTETDQSTTDLPYQGCSGCFQLLSFELVFNSTFYPMVLNIASVPDLTDAIHLNNWTTGGRSSSLIHDTVSMVTSTTPIVTDVAMALEELNLDINLSAEDDTCDPDSKSCVLLQDLAYMLSLRREAVHKSGYRMLYPSTTADKYTKLISDLQKYSDLRNSPNLNRPRPFGLSPAHLPGSPTHSTADLHSLSISFLRYLHNLERMEEAYDDLNIPLFSEQNKDAAGILLQNVYHNTSFEDNTFGKHSCIDDKSVMSFISGIHTDPPLDLSPEFNVTVTEYYATVPYDVYLVKVWAAAQSCYSEARLEDKYGLSRPSNMTLGLGNNRISILVVDHTHTEPWTINTYTLYIYRQQAGEVKKAIGKDTQRSMVCSMVQDCSLRYLPSEACGLQQSRFETWQVYTRVSARLPQCQTGDEQGSWLIPCVSCSRSDSCNWNSAVWQPLTCTHKRQPRDILRECLAGKQILFIGDSTNRGIMHYLMEQVNGTLTEWDKTHDIKTYTNLNQGRTAVSFTYYPQFWLPVNQRPVFDKALYDLIKQAGPLQNNVNTVLVVGGVHWLASQHLRIIEQALKREGLENIRVIIKGLGAGFHQPVDGLHCLTLSEQQKLVRHNSGLLHLAKSQGYRVVDTFNMTMARYRDFLQGKCACHFHRVREVLPSFSQYMQSTGRSDSSSSRSSTKLADLSIMYHVEGSVNAAYSEILLNDVCVI